MTHDPHLFLAIGIAVLVPLGVSCSSHDAATSTAPGETVASATALATLAPAMVVMAPLAATPGPDPLRPACVHHTETGACRTSGPNDSDADGFVVGKDCDDGDALTFPGAREIPCDNVDQDCDGTDYCPADADHDGFSPPGDCDDRNPRRNPGAAEIFCNGIDEDCNGYDDCDADNDGESAPQDCNDRNATISHNAKEVVCDGVDQDCNGRDCCDNDQDGDGVPCRADCDDTDPATFPGAPIPPGCLMKDINCDGVVDGRCR